jgi:hypothetical protein
MKISELVAKYVQLRDKKAEYKGEYEAKVAKIEETLGKIECKLLEVFEQTGMDSVKTEFGTAYKSVRSSASVADRDAFMAYVKANDEWQLVDIRAAKTAVEQFKDVNNDLPPGVNWREERVVNFRRAA